MMRSWVSKACARGDCAACLFGSRCDCSECDHGHKIALAPGPEPTIRRRVPKPPKVHRVFVPKPVRAPRPIKVPSHVVCAGSCDTCAQPLVCVTNPMRWLNIDLSQHECNPQQQQEIST